MLFNNAFHTLLGPSKLPDLDDVGEDEASDLAFARPVRRNVC